MNASKLVRFECDHVGMKSALLALALGSVGCSVFAIEPPTVAQRLAGASASCTHSYALPIVDTAPAAVGVLGGGALLVGLLADAQDPETRTAEGGVAVAVIVGALYALSAWHGYEVVGRCRDADSPSSYWQMMLTSSVMLPSATSTRVVAPAISAGQSPTSSAPPGLTVHVALEALPALAVTS